MTINNNQPGITQFFYIFLPVKTNINKTQTCLICKALAFMIYLCTLTYFTALRT